MTLGVIALLALGGAVALHSTSGGSWTAVVTVSAEKKTGIIHADPSYSAPLVGVVPNGEQVEVLDSRKPGKTWLRVRARLQGASVEGWMHRDILMPVQ
jgi:hypothetical protein